MTETKKHQYQNTTIGAISSFGAQLSLNLGASFSKELFNNIGIFGVTSLRVFLSAVIIIILRKSWKRPVSISLWPSLIAYGLTLGLMNLSIYQAFARIPIGIATGIEVIGPISIVMIGLKKKKDLIWIALAIFGLFLLLPFNSKDGIDLLGILFSCVAATCWALYIVFGKNVADKLGRDSTGWGLIVASFLVVPLGIYKSGTIIFSPSIFFMGLLIAILSSAIPYSLEMEAMQRLPKNIFGIFLSASPAIAAVVGFFVLGETLTFVQWIAIGCIIFASAGSAMSASRHALEPITPE